MDRNFDDLAERFTRRVYGGLKGRIRLAVLQRDIERVVAGREQLRILDIGAGLAQLSVDFAARGHAVTINDISVNMLQGAQEIARQQLATQPQALNNIHWQHCPYQQLDTNQPFDLILCHALLEWVDEPEQVVEFAARCVTPGGVLSLSFYNPAGKIYRNLIRGNFDWLDSQASYQSDAGSLTPNTPCWPEEVKSWLKKYKYQLLSETGIRVFHDYVVEKRGGLADPEQLLAKELEFSEKSPYKHLGRYIHLCAANIND